MDAHLLHVATKEIEAIVGSRISKIYQYDDDIFVFSLYGRGKKQFLTTRTGKNLPFIFLSDTHAARGETPPAHVMRLRKYLVGKRIINMHCAWWARTIFFQVHNEDEKKPVWFKVDLRKGVDLCDSPLETFLQPEWLELESRQELENILTPKSKDYSPYFTPALRKTLQAFLNEAATEDDKDEAFLEIKSLLIDLESGDGDLFMYTDEHGKHELYAWQLPSSLKIDKAEEIFDTPLYALNEYGKSTILTSLTDEVKKKAAKPFVSTLKKLKKLREKLDTEEDRLKAMLDKREIALKLQAHLYELDKEKKVENLEIDGENLFLNKKLTIRENMENLFHQSLRGKRGLSHLITRKQEVEEEIEIAKEKLHSAIALSQVPSTFSVSQGVKKKENSPTSSTRRKVKENNLPKQVLLRESSDGFSILLGKDVKGNKLALKLASPNDYWLHTADGASAHAIIKRDHAGQVVPQSTFDEAGRMVAEKSPFKYDEKALIQYAFAKNIQIMKNASAGMVRIVKSEGSFWISLRD